MSFTGDLKEIVEKNENGLLGAHSSWSRVRLGDVAAILNGFPFDSMYFSKSEGVPLIRIRDILSDSTDSRYTGPLPEGYWVDCGDLLVGMDGDFNCARWRGGRALLNQRVCKIAGDPEYIAHSFLSRVLGGYLAAINKQTSSITVKHLSSKTIADVPLPYPPLPEQKRIADKLDALLARVDACRERLDRVPGILKRFRQSVLAAATSGELTREWREERGYPTGEYQLRPLRDLVREPLRNGKSVRDGNGPRVLRLSSLRNGSIDWREAKSGAWGNIDVKRFLVENGDFLIARGNGSRDLVGRGSLVLGAPPRVAFPDTMIRVRPDPSRVVPRFLKLVWDADSTRSQIEFSARTTAGIWKVAQPDLEATALPVPSLDEQEEIVRRAEGLFSFAVCLEARCRSALSAVEGVTPSTLGKAFRGELIPQDPTDEPASVLLARLKTAQAQRS